MQTRARCYEISTERKKGNTGRPLKRLLDCYVETGTGHEDLLLESVMMIDDVDDDLSR
jgi:hypothetical protein